MASHLSPCLGEYRPPSLTQTVAGFTPDLQANIDFVRTGKFGQSPSLGRCYIEGCNGLPLSPESDTAGNFRFRIAVSCGSYGSYGSCGSHLGLL